MLLESLCPGGYPLSRHGVASPRLSSPPWFTHWANDYLFLVRSTSTSRPASLIRGLGKRTPREFPIRISLVFIRDPATEQPPCHSRNGYRPVDRRQPVIRTSCGGREYHRPRSPAMSEVWLTERWTPRHLRHLWQDLQLRERLVDAWWFVRIRREPSIWVQCGPCLPIRCVPPF